MHSALGDLVVSDSGHVTALYKLSFYCFIVVAQTSFLMQERTLKH